MCMKLNIQANNAPRGECPNFIGGGMAPIFHGFRFGRAGPHCGGAEEAA